METNAAYRTLWIFPDVSDSTDVSIDPNLNICVGKQYAWKNCLKVSCPCGNLLSLFVGHALQNGTVFNYCISHTPPVLNRTLVSIQS